MSQFIQGEFLGNLSINIVSCNNIFNGDNETLTLFSYFGGMLIFVVAYLVLTHSISFSISFF